VFTRFSALLRASADFGISDRWAIYLARPYRTQLGSGVGPGAEGQRDLRWGRLAIRWVTPKYGFILATGFARRSFSSDRCSLGLRPDA
jgi:hypothetical protein